MLELAWNASLHYTVRHAAYGERNRDTHLSFSTTKRLQFWFVPSLSDSSELLTPQTSCFVSGHAAMLIGASSPLSSSNSSSCVRTLWLSTLYNLYTLIQLHSERLYARTRLTSLFLIPLRDWPPPPPRTSSSGETNALE